MSDKKKNVYHSLGKHTINWLFAKLFPDREVDYHVTHVYVLSTGDYAVQFTRSIETISDEAKKALPYHDFDEVARDAVLKCFHDGLDESLRNEYRTVELVPPVTPYETNKEWLVKLTLKDAV